MKHSAKFATFTAFLVGSIFTIPCAAQGGIASPSQSNDTKPAPSDLSGRSYKTKPVPQEQIITPFAVNAPDSAKLNPLEYRSDKEMIDADRALLQNADPAIREAAVLAGIEYDRVHWSRQQLLCHGLPGHIFLLYRGDNGTSDVSLFSAAISLSGNHRVRILPIQRRGFALFSPAPVNALTIAGFNRILMDEPQRKSADWLAICLCYAALTGAHPEINKLTKDANKADLRVFFPPTLEVGSLGDATVRFVDVAAENQPSQWALTFSAKGQLLKVAHFPTPNFAVRPIP